MNPCSSALGPMARFLAIITWFLVVCAPATCASNVTEANAASLAQQGIAAYKRADYQEAIKLLGQRARMTPEDPDVYYYLGNCYVYSKQTDKAAHMYSACVRLAPTSQAGKYSLDALEHLSAGSRGDTAPPALDKAAVDAARDSLVSTEPLDKRFNDAVKRIQSQRSTLKARIDRIYAVMQDDLQVLSPRITACYPCEMERVRREADNNVLELQTRELRFENRLLAPEKIDARAIPQMPQEKPDSSRTALGSLIEYFKPDKPFDPFGMDITPEITAKFMTVKDVFGELSTYQPSARKVAKQVFVQLKSGIENKQDLLDQRLHQARDNLIRDIINITTRYGSTAISYKQMIPGYHASSSAIPRADQGNLTPMDVDVSQTVEQAKKRIKDLEDGYYRDVDALIAGAKQRVGGMVAQTGQMNSQLKHPSGNIQLVPLGTDIYVRNYVNFGERPELLAPADGQPKIPMVQPLKAQAKKLQRGKQTTVPAHLGSKR